jgi:hypothetical protein
MTIKTFWAILIKILGLWLVLKSVIIIPQFFSSLFSINANDDYVQRFAISIFCLLLIIAGYIFILWLFVFKTAWLISKLQLEKGFTEEKIELHIQRPTVLMIAVIILGGIIFVDTLPQLCQQLFEFFQQKNTFKASPDSGWIIFSLVKVTIGYLLMTNSQIVINFIEKQKANQNGTDE